MLSVEIEILKDNQGSIDGYSQGYITLKGEYGTLSAKQSIMVFISLNLMLYQVRKFIMEKNTKAELPVGVDSAFEPLLIRKGEYFSFVKTSGEIINKSSQKELTGAILTEAERIYNTYVKHFSSTDSVVKDLGNTILEFRNM